MEFNNKLNDTILYSFVRQDNIDKLYDLIKTTLDITKKYYKSRKAKKRKNLFNKIKKLNDNKEAICFINDQLDICFQLEENLSFILSDKPLPIMIEELFSETDK